MADPDNPAASRNLGRHRAPDGDAQTAYIPRITDASPDGVPGGPLAPLVGLGTPPQPPPARPTSPPPAAVPPPAVMPPAATAPPTNATSPPAARPGAAVPPAAAT